MDSQYISKTLKIRSLDSNLKSISKAMLVVLEDAPDNIREPLIETVNAGSKRLRPALMLSMAQSSKMTIDKEFYSLCAAVELLHLSSLVHDDIIDKSDTRWSLPTIYSKYGEAIALLAGDYLVSCSLALAAEISLEAFSILNSAYKQMIIGQSLELADINNKLRTTHSYLKSVDGKTVALFAAGCEIVATIAGYNDDERQAVNEFCKYFGRAFQILDDILDFVGNKTGKDLGLDLAAGIYTLPLLLALDTRKREDVLIIGNKPDLKSITTGLIKNGQIADALKVVDYNIDASTKALAIFPSPKLEGLKNMPGSYLRWVIANQMNISLQLD